MGVLNNKLFFLLIVVFYSNANFAHNEFVSIISKVKPAVVTIEVVRGKRKLKPKQLFEKLGESAEFFSGEIEALEKLPYTSTGSGFIVKREGNSVYILTAAHVVAGSSRVKVSFLNGKRKTANILWSSKRSDVALLQVDSEGLPNVELKLSDDLVLEGQDVLVISATLGLPVSSSKGIVSSVSGAVPGKKRRFSLIQIDATVNQGSSGGALINNEGEVIGLVSEIFTRTGSYSGVSFAIPSSVLSSLLLKQSQKSR